MNAQYLNLGTIRENRGFKGISQGDVKELTGTLYVFSIPSYEAYNKKDTQHGEF